MDPLHSETVIKEEQNEFNCDAEEETCFYKEAYNILCRSNMELLCMKHEKSCDGQNTLNNIEVEVRESYNESNDVMNMSDEKDAPCTYVAKKEFQNEKDEEGCEKNQNIKHEIDDRLHSELIIKEEDISNSTRIISTDNRDKNDLDSDFACPPLEDNLTGDGSKQCSSFATKTDTKKLSTKIISSSRESDTNDSINNLEEEYKPKNKRVKKKMSKHSNQRGHTKIHNIERPFKCDKCEKAFSRKNILIQHTFAHTGERPFKCDKCKKAFSTKKYLRQHTFTHTGEKPFKCDKCEKAFSTQHYLIQHTFTHTGESPFKCVKCEKTYTSKNGLINHAFTHTQDRPFKCDKCEKVFSTIQYLIRHTYIHSRERPFKCEKCETIYTSKNDLINHAFTHTQDRPFKCDKCKKTFPLKHILINHTCIHTGERPFRCDKCEKTYSTKWSLNRHSWIIHSGETPKYKCNITFLGN